QYSRPYHSHPSRTLRRTPFTQSRNRCIEGVSRCTITCSCNRLAAKTGAAMRVDSARHLLDAGDQLVDRLVDRHLLIDDAVHRLARGVLFVEKGDLMVLGDLEGHGARLELVVPRLAMLVGEPERARLAGERHRKPAPEPRLDIGAEVFLLQHEPQEVLRLGL